MDAYDRSLRLSSVQEPKRGSRFRNDELDLDRLYEKKRLRNLRELNVYQTVLKQLIRRINRAADDPVADKRGVVFPVPVRIFGEKYDPARCAAWLVNEVENRKLIATCDVMGGEYVLYVSWKHYIPQYEREEIRKRTGIIVDCSGAVCDPAPDSTATEEETKNEAQAKKRVFTSLHDFQPTRTGVYNEEQLRNVARKL